jgi:hypothetical protein
MVHKSSCAGALLVCFLLNAGPLAGLEKTIELGKEELWGDTLSLEGVSAVPGRWGFRDLALESGAYTPDSATECLLHFDAAAERDATGGYAVAAGGALISDSAFAMGGGSAAFTGGRQGLSIQGPPNGMFGAGAAWGDFTIEFWLDPATLSDGETLLYWTGSAKNPGGGISGQTLRCFLRDRRLVWDFQNIFTLPPAGDSAQASRIPVTLSGTRQLLPRAWHHHLLRFDSRRGLLEYQLDGTPEAMLHVTDTGRETGSIAMPEIGKAYASPLVLGQGFTGFMDELRISRALVSGPVLTRFLGRTGSATFRIIDLGFSATRIARIEAVTSTPSDSAVEFSYQAADRWNGKKLLAGEDGWTPFIPGTDFGDGLKARFIQLRVDLYPDGTRTQSPRVSSLKIVYEPNIPPAYPAGLTALPGNGKVTLSWRRVNDLNVKGYMVYYGASPHDYLGTGATQGDSPVDAGSATTIEIGGLANGSLYYFSVVAYDDSDPRQQSGFSPEVSARPSRIYK